MIVPVFVLGEKQITQGEATELGLQISPKSEWYWQDEEDHLNEGGFETFSETLESSIKSMIYSDNLSADDEEDGIHRLNVWDCGAGYLYVPFKRNPAISHSNEVDFYFEFTKGGNA